MANPTTLGDVVKAINALSKKIGGGDPAILGDAGAFVSDVATDKKRQKDLEEAAEQEKIRAKERRDAAKEAVEFGNQEKQTRKEIIDLLKNQIDADLAYEEKRIEYDRATLERKGELTEKAKKGLAERGKTQRALARENIKAHDEELKKIEKTEAATKKMHESMGGVVKESLEFAKALGFQATKQESIIGKLRQSFLLFKGSNAVSEEQLQKFKDQYHWQVLLSEVLENIKDLSLVIIGKFTHMLTAWDSASAAFNKATGAAGRFDAEMANLISNTTDAGGNIESVTAAYGGLITGMADFTTLSKTQRKAIAATGVQLEMAGVSAETYASNMDFLTKGMKMNADAAAAHQANLAEFASSIGVTTAKMAEDFKASQPIMARYGKAVGDKMFKNLAKTAKAAGIEMQALLGIAAGFDTFEDAATKVGQLNALLGGPYLNSIEMLTAKEDERIDMLRKSLQMSGRTWKELGRFERQSIATAAGISDMVEAGKLFGTTDKDFRKVQQEQKKLADQAKASQNIQAKLNQIMMQFLPLAQELVVWLKNIADKFLAWQAENKGAIKTFAIWIVGLGVALKVIVPLVTFIGMLSQSIWAASAATKALSVGMSIVRAIGMTMGIGVIVAAISALLYYLVSATDAWKDFWGAADEGKSSALSGWSRPGDVVGGGRAGNRQPILSVPSYTPNAHDGAIITKSGVANVQAGERVIPAAKIKPLPAGNRTAATTNGKTEVKLYIGKREFASVVVDALENGILNLA